MMNVRPVCGSVVCLHSTDPPIWWPLCLFSLSFSLFIIGLFGLIFSYCIHSCRQPTVNWKGIHLCMFANQIVFRLFVSFFSECSIVPYSICRGRPTDSTFFLRRRRRRFFGFKMSAFEQWKTEKTMKSKVYCDLKMLKRYHASLVACGRSRWCHGSRLREEQR